MERLGNQAPLLRLRFESGREACRYLLQRSRTPEGHFLPITATELAPRLQAEGFCVTTLDAEALLRELAAEGEIDAIDEVAGYRWIPRAA
jgi:hypothetical protein